MLTVFAFCIAIFIFSGTAYAAYKSVATPADLFHTRSEQGSLVSIIVGNVTLGTGVVYYLGLLDTGVIAALAALFGVLFGYLIFYQLIKDSGFNPQKHENIYSYALSYKDFSQSNYYKILKWIIPIVFILIIASELYFSAPIIVAAIGFPNTPGYVAGVALAIGCVGALYAVVGGIRGVIYTDYIQFTFLVLMLCAMGALVVFFSNMASEIGDPNGNLPNIMNNMSVASIFVTLAALFSAISTQFYNVVNVGMASNFQGEKAGRLFLVAGIGLFAIFSVILIIGYFIPAGEKAGSEKMIWLIREITSGKYEYTMLGVALDGAILLVLVFGMFGVLLSTIDSGVILAGELIFENIGGDSNSNKTAEISYARRLIGICSIIGMVVFVLLFSIQPKIVPLMMTATFPLVMMAPIMAGGLRARMMSRKTVLGHNKIERLAIAVIGIGWASVAYATVNGEPEVPPMVTAIAWLVLVAVVVTDDVRFKKEAGK